MTKKRMTQTTVKDDAHDTTTDDEYIGMIGGEGATATAPKKERKKRTAKPMRRLNVVMAPIPLVLGDIVYRGEEMGRVTRATTPSDTEARVQHEDGSEEMLSLSTLQVERK